VRRDTIHSINEKQPSTDVKFERFWLKYDRPRWRFSSLDEFINWYNLRFHGALWMEIGESPGEAVYRKNQPGSMLGLLWGMV